jgi:hypothetical protein
MIILGLLYLFIVLMLSYTEQKNKYTVLLTACFTCLEVIYSIYIVQKSSYFKACTEQLTFDPIENSSGVVGIGIGPCRARRRARFQSILCLCTQVSALDVLIGNGYVKNTTVFSTRPLHCKLIYIIRVVTGTFAKRS